MLGVTLFLVVASEVAIYLAWLATGSSKFDTIYGNSLHLPKWRTANRKYPHPSNGILKIATFGGSSAAGAASERGFADILQFELTRHLGEGKAYVRNYAEGGAPFHGFQAEMAKALAPYYDVIVVYAGNNEWVPPYFKRGGLDVIGVRETHDPAPSWRRKIAGAAADARGDIGVIETMRRHSRVFAVAWKASVKLTQVLARSGAAGRTEEGVLRDSSARRPPLTADRKTLSGAEIETALKNYAVDLRAVLDAATRHGAALVVVGANGNETWPPHFSMRPEGADDRTAAEIDKTLSAAESLIDRKRFDEARALVTAVLKTAPRHAFANHLMGGIASADRNARSRWSHLEAAIDEDAYPMRAISETRRAAAAMSGKFYAYMPHVDTVRRLVDEGITAHDMWSDIVHPSMLNHALIARDVLCAMERMGRVAGMERFCRRIDAAEARRMDADYRAAMGVEPWETSE